MHNLLHCLPLLWSSSSLLPFLCNLYLFFNILYAIYISFFNISSFPLLFLLFSFLLQSMFYVYLFLILFNSVYLPPTKTITTPLETAPSHYPTSTYTHLSSSLQNYHSCSDSFSCTNQ